MPELTENQEWPVHSFTYQMNGREWSVNLPGRTEQEARERLGRAAAGYYDGELLMSIPLEVGFWVPAYCWIRKHLVALLHPKKNDA